MAALLLEFPEVDAKIAGNYVGKLIKKYARKLTMQGTRVDGRGFNEIRPIFGAVDLLPRVHGSALFTRGQTQVLSSVTLGSGGDRQRIDTVNFDEVKRYVHHYNFPPYSVGEVRFMRGAGRREIGHGALAEKAIVPVLPTEERVRLQHARGQRSDREQRLEQHGQHLRQFAGADGGRRAAQAPRRRDQHRAGHGRRGLQAADGPLGLRGLQRRHGLQSRGHGRRHHGDPARREDRGPDAADDRGDAAPGAGRLPQRRRADERGHRRGPRRRSAPTLRCWS